MATYKIELTLHASEDADPSAVLDAVTEALPSIHDHLDSVGVEGELPEEAVSVCEEERAETLAEHLARLLPLERRAERLRGEYAQTRSAFDRGRARAAQTRAEGELDRFVAKWSP